MLKNVALRRAMDAHNTGVAWWLKMELHRFDEEQDPDLDSYPDPY